MQINSIVQDTKECFKCKATQNLHEHHCLFGANRKVSERLGLKVWLCGYHHNQSTEGVHTGNHELDIECKMAAQEAYERTHTREEWMREIGKNYL